MKQLGTWGEERGGEEGSWREVRWSSRQLQGPLQPCVFLYILSSPILPILHSVNDEIAGTNSVLAQASPFWAIWHVGVAQLVTGKGCWSWPTWVHVVLCQGLCRRHVLTIVTSSGPFILLWPLCHSTWRTILKAWGPYRSSASLMVSEFLTILKPATDHWFPER